MQINQRQMHEIFIIINLKLLSKKARLRIEHLVGKRVSKRNLLTLFAIQLERKSSESHFQSKKIEKKIRIHLLGN